MAKVLIVDEDAVLREFVESSLAAHGFEVDTAAGVSPAKESRYDAILSDIERPFSLDKLQHRLRLMGLTDAA